MDDPRSSRCIRACVHACVRSRAHECTCTHFRCRLIDAGRAAHTHRVNLRSVERFAASSSCSFFPTVPHLSLSHFFARATRASFARYRPPPSFPCLSIRFLSRLTLLIAFEISNVDTWRSDRRRSPYPANVNATEFMRRTRVREKRTRVKGEARDAGSLQSMSIFFPPLEIPGISGGLIVNLSNSSTCALLRK